MSIKKTAPDTKTTVDVSVRPLKLEVAMFAIEGDAPLVLNRFSKKGEIAMREKQEAGQQAQSRRKREPKDFEEQFRGACYNSHDGWYGIHASSFRNAAISACRTAGYTMTRAKLALKIIADGFDALDGTPLVRLYGEPKMDVRAVRNETGVADLRARPMWAPGWTAKLKVEYDADMFSLQDVTNLVHRMGAQVGVGAGRPDSKDSAGCGWGTFKIKQRA